MIRWRSSRALRGGTAPIAFSTARIEAIACTVVQTPQMRCVNTQASRGSRPFRMISMPRNIVDDDQASRHAPPPPRRAGAPPGPAGVAPRDGGEHRAAFFHADARQRLLGLVASRRHDRLV